MTEFPRSSDTPKQSPLYWVQNKDRYLRQLLIKDIEAVTGRELVVYFTDCDNTPAQIEQSDDVAFHELLDKTKNDSIDLLLETNGGFTDATEKICGLLRQRTNDLRVIVPRRAKSNGTVIALCGSSILMGPQSELGPIDPFVLGVPAEFIVKAPPGTVSPIDIQYAESARAQTEKLAKTLLKTGMMAAFDDQQIDDTVHKLATKEHYHSHGSSIDADEAKYLNLNVQKLLPEEDLWKKVWLLRTMYQYDCMANGYSKLFESNFVSSSVLVKPQT